MISINILEQHYRRICQIMLEIFRLSLNVEPGHSQPGRRSVNAEGVC